MNYPTGIDICQAVSRRIHYPPPQRNSLFIRCLYRNNLLRFRPYLGYLPAARQTCHERTLLRAGRPVVCRMAGAPMVNTMLHGRAGGPFCDCTAPSQKTRGREPHRAAVVSSRGSISRSRSWTRTSCTGISPLISISYRSPVRRVAVRAPAAFLGFWACRNDRQ